MTGDEVSDSSLWSREQNKAFENALATYPEDLSDRWEKIAADVPGKTLEEVKHHYELLVEDVTQIESGSVPLPCYNSSSEGSSSHVGDEAVGKKGSHFSNSESNHGGKASRSDQERRKGVAWTEDEHRKWINLLKFKTYAQARRKFCHIKFPRLFSVYYPHGVRIKLLAFISSHTLVAAVPPIPCYLFAFGLKINLEKSELIPIGEVSNLEDLVGALGWGLGIRDLSILNEALLGKWSWRFSSERDPLWKWVIVGKTRGGWCSKVLREGHCVGVWKAIKGRWQVFKTRIGFKVGFGKKVKFWKDKWFTRQLHDWELEEVQAFLGRLSAHPIFVETDDAMVWLPMKDDTFSVKSFYSSLANRRVELFLYSIVWNSWVSLRISFFA
ncbi:Transcription factor SRM1 [Vitis vinifera]|uniref:Transcription factor SRM1 n=1 Tax=Vitis vinifera TaxID=29760 RepID=A0A438K4Z0_VITVI|nr:Transcription factor SRM1 [Vitis vinifera]